MVEYDRDEDGNVFGTDQVLLGIGAQAAAGEPDVWIDIGGLDHDAVQAVRTVVLAALDNWPTP